MKKILKIGCSGLGDILCASPILRKLYETYEEKFIVFTYVPELFKNNPCVEQSLHLSEFESINQDEYLIHSVCYYDGKLNLTRTHIAQYPAGCIGIQLLPEELTLEFYPKDYQTIDNLPDKYIVIHPSKTWPSRTWGENKWQNLIYDLNQKGIPVVAIGKETDSDPSDRDKKVFNLDIPLGLNLLNKTDLSQTWHVINKAELIITMDTGILHLAGTTDTHIIQLGSSINPIFRSPYRHASQDYKYDYVMGSCDKFCASDMKYRLKEHGSIFGIPPIGLCIPKQDSFTFECHPEVEAVIKKVESVLKIEKKTILYIAPHLSTGGMPEFLRKRIELLKDVFNIYVAEFTCYGGFTVQRDKIIDMIGKDHFYSLGGLNEDEKTYLNNRLRLIDIIKEIKPHVIHLDEVITHFNFGGFPDELAQFVYSSNREYKIFETCHDLNHDGGNRKYLPDKFLFVSDANIPRYKKYNVPMEVIEYPIEYKNRPDRDETLKSLSLDTSYKHVLNVGLFTRNKNQGYIFDMAKQLEKSKIQFHFIGNMADNFKDYWEPIIKSKPDNCIIWGERNDVDRFCSCMDAFVFPSLYELNPICVKEAMGWHMPVLLKKLDVYKNENNVFYLTDKIKDDIDILIKILFQEHK